MIPGAGSGAMVVVRGEADGPPTETTTMMTAKPPKAYPSLHLAIVREMERQGLTQTALAERAGIDRTIVNRYVNGAHDTSGENIDAMLRALKIKIRPHMAK